jgi:hypothetical protein
VGGGRAQAGQVRSTGPSDAWAVDGFAPLPGDTVGLPGDERGLVEAVYLCAEPGGDEVTHWSWIVLADGRMLEVAPRGCALYEPPQVLQRGTGPFLELVAQDGALVRFEERVRAGTWESRPVRLTLGGRRWRVTSTGTVSAQRLGGVPPSGWGHLRVGPYPPAQEPDVYFTFVGQHDGDALGLGVWATDVCLAFGRRLGESPPAAGLRMLGDERSSGTEVPD